MSVAEISTPIRRMRQSLLSKGDTCAKKLEHHFNPDVPNDPGGEFTVAGSAYHAGIEQLYLKPDSSTAELNDAVFEGFRSNANDLPPALRATLTWEDYNPHTEEGAIEQLQGMVQDYAINHMWDLDDFEVIATEDSFAYSTWRDGWHATGTLDLVLQAKEHALIAIDTFAQSDGGKWVRTVDALEIPAGAHVIVDHKTARKPWQRGKESAKQTNQPAWYVHWWRYMWAMRGGTPPPAVLFFFDVFTTDGRSFERRHATPTDAEVKAVQRKAQDVAELVEKGGPFLPNTQSFLCTNRWCGYWDHCEFGAAMQEAA